MTVTLLASKSETQLLRHLAAAVRNDDYEAFCMHTEAGINFFDQPTVKHLLNEQLPLLLDEKYIPRYLKFMIGDGDYLATVRDFLTEMTQILVTEGFQLGKDFSYGEDDEGVPYLRMSEAIALRVENIYEPHAWKQCRPYLRVGN